MNGVEILSQSIIYETEFYWWILIAFAIAGLLFSLIVSIIDWIKYGFDKSSIWFILIVTLIFSVFGGVYTAISEHETDTVDYITYKVTISDEVSLREFTDKYTIINQDGKIYTVKEKD